MGNVLGSNLRGNPLQQWLHRTHDLLPRQLDLLLQLGIAATTRSDAKKRTQKTCRTREATGGERSSCSDIEVLTSSSSPQRSEAIGPANVYIPSAMESRSSRTSFALQLATPTARRLVSKTAWQSALPGDKHDYCVARLWRRCCCCWPAAFHPQQLQVVNF